MEMRIVETSSENIIFQRVEAGYLAAVGKSLEKEEPAFAWKKEGVSLSMGWSKPEK